MIRKEFVRLFAAVPLFLLSCKAEDLGEKVRASISPSSFPS
jgi:hypothetical protein